MGELHELKRVHAERGDGQVGGDGLAERRRRVDRDRLDPLAPGRGFWPPATTGPRAVASLDHAERPVSRSRNVVIHGSNRHRTDATQPAHHPVSVLVDA